MLVATYTDFEFQTPFPLGRPGAVDCTQTGSAHFTLDADVSGLFPYINAAAEHVRYLARPPHVQLVLDGIACTLHPRDVIAVPFTSAAEGRRFADRLLEYLNDLHARRDTLTPDHRQHAPASVLALFRALPGTNCRQCGEATCLAFAVALSRGRATPAQCPDMPAPLATKVEIPIYGAGGELVDRVALEVEQAQQDSAPAAPTTAPSPDRHGLTERELEVLRLVAQGASNIEIAAILAITPHTVKSHVTHIFNKLGVDDRTRAAVWAVRQRLV